MTAAASRSYRPARTGTPPEPPGPAGDGPRLRLAAARGTLGLELDEPFTVRPLRVVALSLTFPNIRFPIDLSGGVSRFRHRRGALARLAIDVSAAEIASWAAPRLRGILRDATPDLWVAGIEGGLAVGIADGEAALAFDVLVVPSGEALTLVTERARGMGLGGPPQALAMRALAAALRGVASVEDGAVRISDAAGAILRDVLPAAGARSPSAAGCTWGYPMPDGDRLLMEAQIDAPPPALPDRLVRANETLLLAAVADDAAYRGDPDRARDGYLAALERAPRHPEISERLAWLDATLGDRAEAALSTLVEVVPAAFAGVLGAELLAAVGDVDGGRAALTRAAPAEPFGPLAARVWMRAAALAESLRERLAALDEAVARVPALADARWARLAARLAAADPRAALADAEHLEAAARGARARHEIARRAARMFLAEGFATEALRLFERALRYVPEDAEAVAGLARSLAAQGAKRRALELFARALGLAERASAPTSAVAIDLAKALVEVTADRPAAIARVRTVPASAPEAAEARLLEARWRSELGDLAGAGLAIGRLRDQVERDPLVTGAPSISGSGAFGGGRTGADAGEGAGVGGPAPGTAEAARAAALAALLVEAGTIDERARDDLAGAQRDLGLALRLLPRDGRIQASFRRVARENARRAAAPRPVAGAAPAMPPPPRRATAAARARAPSPMPPVPPPPPSVDLGVELPIVDRGLRDPDRFDTSDLEIELPTMRPEALPSASFLAEVERIRSRQEPTAIEPPRDIDIADLRDEDDESGTPSVLQDSRDDARRRISAAHERDDAHRDHDEPRDLDDAHRDHDEPRDLDDAHRDHDESRDLDDGRRTHEEAADDDATFHAGADEHADEDEESALAQDEALAQELSDKLRANPRDRATVLALCDVLDRLGRDLELFALVSARMDEGDAEERGTLAPIRHAVLARLAERARAAGNGSEAELYEMMLAASE
ncbi:MAG: hypothetical protein U0441_30535 [Polyangiaceae bacterium]